MLDQWYNACMHQTWEITAETELAPVVAVVLHHCASAAVHDAAVVLALHGDLGAGKTTFMQHLAATLGVTELVVSPTFVIMKHYLLSGSDPFTDLYHLDAYRIEDELELTPLGLTQLLSEPTALVAIEWAERIDSMLPTHTLHLSFEIHNEQRVISLTTSDNA